MPQAIMTKRALGDSLKKLMQKRPLNKITVKQIVEDCNVNRQTFYYHFQDIYELLGWVYETEVVEAIEERCHFDNWQENFLKAFQYVLDNRSFCLNTYHSMGREHLESFFFNVVYRLCGDVIDELAEGLEIEEEDKQFVINFYSIAFMGLVMQWMNTGMKYSPEKIIAHLDIMIGQNVKETLRRFELKKKKQETN